MKLDSRQIAAAVLLLCPLVLYGQDAALPSAPSAVMAESATSVPANLVISNIALSANSADRSHLNTEQKFSNFVEQSMSPYATFSSALAASFRPSWNNSQYSENYAGRLGQTISDRTEQGFFSKFLLPTMLHQDPRYYRSQQQGKVDRAVYALSRVLITRNDNGKATLNTSELLGMVIASSLTTAYHSYRQPTVGDTANRAAAGIGADAGMNMLREFWPDIRNCVMDHGPKVMQNLVTRLSPRLQTSTLAPAPQTVQ